MYVQQEMKSKRIYMTYKFNSIPNKIYMVTHLYLSTQVQTVTLHSICGCLLAAGNILTVVLLHVVSGTFEGMCTCSAV